MSPMAPRPIRRGRRYRGGSNPVSTAILRPVPVSRRAETGRLEEEAAEFGSAVRYAPGCPAVAFGQDRPAPDGDRGHQAMVSRLAAALLAALGLTGPSFQRAATPPPPPDPSFFVAGHGWGHGVGLAQYGAYGYALHGWTYD